MAQTTNQDFPCSLTLRVPLPNPRLADVALKAIQVDPELSPLVRRKLSVVPDEPDSSIVGEKMAEENPGRDNVLLVKYRATTNRMLRVAVNSFMDSLKLVLEVMEKLDSDVVDTREQNDAPS